MSWFNRAALVVLLALALAACGAVPRPFQPEEKSDPEGLLLPPDRTGVVVLPVDGLPESAAAAFAEAVAEALRKDEIIASAGGPSAGRLRLAGALSGVQEGRPRFAFELRDRKDAVILVHDTRPASILGDPHAPPTWRTPAQEVAVAVSNMLRSQLGRAAPSRAIKIGAVSGVPADGEAALARALAHNLDRLGVRLADGGDAAALAVTGSIRVGARDRTERRIAVVWTVHQPDGTPLGDIRQENDVPAEYLAGRWPELAQAIAEGAADGIVQLLQRTAATGR